MAEPEIEVIGEPHDEQVEHPDEISSGFERKRSGGLGRIISTAKGWITVMSRRGFLGALGGLSAGLAAGYSFGRGSSREEPSPQPTQSRETRPTITPDQIFRPENYGFVEDESVRFVDFTYEPDQKGSLVSASRPDRSELRLLKRGDQSILVLRLDPAIFGYHDFESLSILCGNPTERQNPEGINLPIDRIRDLLNAENPRDRNGTSQNQIDNERLTLVLTDSLPSDIGAFSNIFYIGMPLEDLMRYVNFVNSTGGSEFPALRTDLIGKGSQISGPQGGYSIIPHDRSVHRQEFFRNNKVS